MTHIGPKIKVARILQGMTLKELANAVGVREATIQRYESGKIKDIPLERIYAIADAIGIPSELLSNENDQLSDLANNSGYIEHLLEPSDNAGNNIRTLRKARNMTVEELADIVGVSRQTIYRYESGNVTNVSPGTIKKLADALHTSIAYIKGKVSDPNDISPETLSAQELTESWIKYFGTPDDTSISIKKRSEIAKAQQRLIDVARSICDAGYTSSDSEDVRTAQLPKRLDQVTDFLVQNAAVLRRSILSKAEDSDMGD